MLYHVGKFLQIVGLVVALGALLIGFETDDPTTELKLLAAGAAFFTLGWFLEKKASSPD